MDDVEDKEILLGIFSMVGMILERMTGEIPVVKLRDKEGIIHPTYYNNSSVSWFKLKAEAVSQPCGQQE